MTDSNESDFSFTWCIERFSLLELECVRSACFTVPELGKEKWLLMMSDSDRNLWFHLYRIGDSSNKFIPVSRHIRIMIGNGETPTSLKYYKSSCIINREELLKEMKISRSDNLTVNCSLRRQNNVVTPLAQKSETRTRLFADRTFFEWPLKFLESSRTVIGIKYFFIESMFYKIEAETERRHVTISISSLLKNSSKNDIYGKIVLFNERGEKLILREEIHSFKPGNETCSFRDFLTEKGIQNNSQEIVKDGEIVLQCEFRLLCEQKVTFPKPETDACSNIGSILNLMDDFRELFFSGNHSDVELIAENKVVKANRYVLAARSPVFSALFDSDMLESRTGEVVIKDVDEDTLLSFLTFAYTGDLDNLDYERALNLVLIAEKYQVDFLKKECCSFLISNICVKNVCTILELSDMVEHAILKRCCMKFIATDFTGVFNSMQWPQMMKKNAELASKVTLYIGHYCTYTYIQNKVS